MKDFTGKAYRSAKWAEKALMPSKVIDRVEILGEGRVNCMRSSSVKSVRAKIISGDWWMMIGGDTVAEIEAKIESMIALANS